VVNEDDYWALREDCADIPVADIGEMVDRRRTGRGPRSRRVAAVALIVALVTAGGVVAAHVSNDNGARRRVSSGTQHSVKTIDDGQARLDVLAALNTTTASGSFTIHYLLTTSPGNGTTTTTETVPCRTAVLQSPPAIGGPVSEPVQVVGGCGYAGPEPTNVTISGDGVVHVDPTAMATTASVPSLGEITTRVDGTNVWEDGGANYGMASASTGPGSPLSQFANLVSGTLGRREGAIAMNSLASPTGYLDIAKQAITATSKVGDATVDGVPVQQYDVTIDTMKALDVPALTPEETKATTAALAVLRQEGYTTTSVQLSIDALGFIRRAHTVVHFADGGMVTGDTTFSDFGCSSVVLRANGPSIVPNPAGCAAPATTTTVTAPISSTTPTT
jgi:hypothetical protein